MRLYLSKLIHQLFRVLCCASQSFVLSKSLRRRRSGQAQLHPFRCCFLLCCQRFQGKDPQAQLLKRISNPLGAQCNTTYAKSIQELLQSRSCKLYFEIGYNAINYESIHFKIHWWLHTQADECLLARFNKQIQGGSASFPNCTYKETAMWSMNCRHVALKRGETFMHLLQHFAHQAWRAGEVDGLQCRQRNSLQGMFHKHCHRRVRFRSNANNHN
mmetsp:Transcript_6569/g.10530  ORF Transcript_6569/g.10530 Transcript_6569/m.10530 type:complete len:215 (+) Transcript_6569:2312-2956(+)